MNSPVTNTEQKNIAIVTGAGSGIGRAIALGLADAGYNVVLAGRTPEKLNDTIKLAEENTSSFIAIPTDVSQPESVKHLFSETKERFDRLDLLFNNAGINVPAKSIEDVELSDWLKVVNTNLTGMFLCLQGAIRLMKSQNPIGGRIINNGSISAHAPRPGSAPYTATKHAVTGLTKSASLDCRKFNIACGQIDIGNAQTSMAAKMSQGVPQADGSIATEPTMDVEDVTRAVLYMAQLPLDTNVPFMTVMANEMPYIGRG